MKGSSYETGLGKARSGRKQLRDSGRGLARRSGVERQGGATHGAWFQPPVEPAAWKGLVPGLRRKLTVREIRPTKIWGFMWVYMYVWGQGLTI